MAAQFSKKAALPLAKILATASCRSSKTGPRALSYYSDLTLSQEFQLMVAQLSMKTVLPLVKILAASPINWDPDNTLISKWIWMYRTIYISKHRLTYQRPVLLKHTASQFKDIVTDTQKYMPIKCILCSVWVQNFVWNFKGALWNFTQNFKPIHRKICILLGVKNLTTSDILELWHLKFYETGPGGDWSDMIIFNGLHVITRRFTVM